MTYESDPTRWTDAASAAPDSLRDAFAAARKEGPSDLQMRALALKLTAMSGSAALAASASSAHAAAIPAASAGAATASASLTLGKIALSVALLSGAVLAGTAMYRAESAPAARHEEPRSAAPAVQPALEVPALASESGEQKRGLARPRRSAEAPARGEKLAATERVATSERSELAAAPQRASARASEERSLEATSGEDEVSARSVAPDRARAQVSSKREARRAERRARAAAAAAMEQDAPAEATRAPEPRPTRSAAGRVVQKPEIELLRRARENLDARPHEAYRLTELHREEYPDGLFAQERDALAIEALMRTGELKQARSRAEAFIASYPSSAHAHRFRETMGLK